MEKRSFIGLAYWLSSQRYARQLFLPLARPRAHAIQDLDDFVIRHSNIVARPCVLATSAMLLL